VTGVPFDVSDSSQPKRNQLPFNSLSANWTDTHLSPCLTIGRQKSMYSYDAQQP
jgi:hypothetical protein